MLIALVSGIKGIRFTLVIHIPLLISCGLLWMKEMYDRKEVKLLTNMGGVKSKLSISALLLLISNGMGYILNQKYFSIKYSFYSYEDITFGNLDNPNLFARIGDKITGTFHVLGYSYGVPVFSLEGIKNVLIVLVVIIFIYCCCNIIKNCKDYSSIQLNAVIFVISSILFNLFIFILTDNFVARYFVPVIIWIIIVFAAYLNRKAELLWEKIVKLGIGVVLAFYMFIACMHTVQWVETIKANDHRMEAIAFLKGNNYSFGYSTYWNGNIVTALTNEEVELANILSPETMDYYMWNTNKEYYVEGYHSRKCFIILTSDEVEQYAECPVILGGNIVY